MQFASDHRLNEKLSDWHDLLDRLKPLEEKFLSLEGEEESLYGRIFLAYTEGTIAQREALVHSSVRFMEFKRDLAKTKAEYLDCKRRLELKIKAFEAEYLTMKVEAEAIKKHR